MLLYYAGIGGHWERYSPVLFLCDCNDRGNLILTHNTILTLIISLTLTLILHFALILIVAFNFNEMYWISYISMLLVLVSKLTECICSSVV